MKTKHPEKPTATMLLSSHCTHCPSVLSFLAEMIKKGQLSSLNIINLEQNPDAMKTYNVRSVPWIKIGKYELTGAQSLEALEQRVAWAMLDQDAIDESDKNSVPEFDFFLSDGQVNKVIEAIEKDHSAMQAIMVLLGDSGTVLSTRIGIGVVFETFAGKSLLKSLVPQLGELSNHDDERIQADSLHYLGMTADERAIVFLNKARNNSNSDEIHEIITDSLDELSESI